MKNINNYRQMFFQKEKKSTLKYKKDIKFLIENGYPPNQLLKDFNILDKDLYVLLAHIDDTQLN